MKFHGELQALTNPVRNAPLNLTHDEFAALHDKQMLTLLKFIHDKICERQELYEAGISILHINSKVVVERLKALQRAGLIEPKRILTPAQHGVLIECHKCGHRWEYGGRSKRGADCTKCNAAITFENAFYLTERGRMVMQFIRENLSSFDRVAALDTRPILRTPQRGSGE